MEYQEAKLIANVIKHIVPFKEIDDESTQGTSNRDILELVRAVSEKFVVQRVTMEAFFSLLCLVAEDKNYLPIFKVNKIGEIDRIDIQEVIDFLEEQEMDINIEKPEEEENIQPELQNIMDAIEKWVEVNDRNVSFIGSFIAFDKEKIERDEENIVKDGAERIFAFGPKEILLIDLENLTKQVNEEDDFIIW